MAKAFRNCPSCNKPNHVKRACCTDCGHKFPGSVNYSKKVIEREIASTIQTVKPKVKASKKKNELKEKREYLPSGNIYTPAGKCPVNLTSPVYQHVYSWVKALNNKFDNRLSFEAFVYYLNEFFPRFGNWKSINPQFKEATDNLILCLK